MMIETSLQSPLGYDAFLSEISKYNEIFVHEQARRNEWGNRGMPRCFLRIERFSQAFSRKKNENKSKID